MKASLLRNKIAIVPVNRRSFVSGLFWQPLKAARTFRKEAAIFAKGQGFDFATYHVTRGVMQAGYAPASAWRAKGSYSLAASLMEPLGESWIAAFELPDGSFAMAAAHAGAIMAGSDVNGTEQEVRATFNEFSALALGAGKEWGKVIAPFAWGSNADDLVLSQLIGDRSPKSARKLRPLTFRVSKLQLIVAVGGVGAALAIGIGAKSYIGRKNEEARLERIFKAQQLIEEKQRLDVHRALVEGPWSARPPAGLMVATCAMGWSAVPLNISGWIFDNGRCSTGNLTAVYRRKEPATVDGFAREVRNDFGDPVIRENGEVAAISFSTEMGIVDEGALPSINEQIQAFLSHVQAMGVATELSEMKKGGVPEATPGDPEPVALWHSHEFTFNTQFPPELLFAELNRPGIRINHIDLVFSHETAEMTWTVAGDIYGK